MKALYQIITESMRDRGLPEKEWNDHDSKSLVQEIEDWEKGLREYQEQRKLSA